MNIREDKPLVSFIITYYNLPVQMLQECIDSILALSLRPFEREIIVIDDGSDQSPINDLMKYGDDIIYVRQKNGGLSMARNKGLDVATGEYIQFVDADDQLIQAPYEQCLDIIRYQQEADMVLFDFSSNLHVETHLENVQPVSGSDYMRNNNIHGTAWGYIFRLSILGKLRFTPAIYHEDEEFTPQLLLRAEKVYPTHAKAYYYVKRDNSITSSKTTTDTEKRINDREGVIIRLHELCDKLPHQDRAALERRVAQLTMDYIYQIIIETHSGEVLSERLSRLYDKGLFPLPKANYSKKYVWFRRMTNSSVGRTILLHSLPLLRKER
ncbi:MAG: glycosyltransferase [Prevotella sp.]|nr:glycosyltransferase [Prevotella sp.]